SGRGHDTAFVQANVPNLEAGPCQYIDHLGFNGRPFNGEGHDTLAADALDLEATGLVGGNRRKEMAEPVNAVGRQVLVHGAVLTGALVLGRLDKRVEPAIGGCFEGVDADSHSGDRQALEVEEPAVDGHVVARQAHYLVLWDGPGLLELAGLDDPARA